MSDLIAVQVAVLATLTFIVLFFHQGLLVIESHVRSLREANEGLEPMNRGTPPEALKMNPVEAYLAEMFPNGRRGTSRSVRWAWRGLTYLTFAAIAFANLALWAGATFQFPWTVDFAPSWLRPNAAGLSGAAYLFLVALTVLVALFGFVRIASLYRVIEGHKKASEKSVRWSVPQDATEAPELSGPEPIDESRIDEPGVLPVREMIQPISSVPSTDPSPQS